ncbi:MAG: 50S ribosomal protein L28 [Hyphomicrobiales bacterium]|nr:50S ribosomal protein L28 [Rickettsiales bacterium]MCP5361675.1 50S ribosomal protein L28 [Hyphomicrobiales bacterium]
MAKRCSITDKGVQSGNKVSHSQRKTRRRFLPNIQNVSLISNVLGKAVRLKIAASTLRSIDHNGGLDNYLLSTADNKLSADVLKLKRQIKKAKQNAA